MTHDPMLGTVTAYTMDVSCMDYCYGGSPRLEVDEWPDDNCVVKWADLPDLIARVREDERGKRRMLPGGGIAGYREGYAAALCDAVEAVKALPWQGDITDPLHRQTLAVAAIEALRGGA